MKSEEEYFEQFLDQHGIKILDTSKRAPRFSTYDLFHYTNDYNKVKEIKLDTEKVFVVEIAESELRKIAAIETKVFNYMYERGTFDLFSVMIQQKEDERYLKEKFPSVQKAFENYSLMLALAKSGEL